ncbi:unnamed protein product [Rhizophagus irregularis]|nr:unnamed protein product [Rhizophagus irregularis]CAB5362794.1 unnamed protein product [Rhizophagus irregularis]
MPRPNKRIQQCRDIAKKRKNFVEVTDISSSDDGNSIEDEVGWIDNKIENEADQIFSTLMKNMETLKKFKHPLVNLGNSCITKYRKKIKASENQKKNRQTLFQLLSKKSSQENLGSELQDIDNQNEGELKEKNGEEPIKYIPFIEKIEDKLKIEDQQLTSGHKMRLKATQYYFHLLEREHSKLNASQMVAEMLNRGVWFARCVRRSSLIDDENIQLKVASYLRQHKFDVTINSFCNFVNEEILSSIGIENKTTISEKTANRWLKKMGFTFSRYAKGMYVDSHERDDVIAYQKEFLETMERYQSLMLKFIGEECETQVNPELEETIGRLKLSDDDMDDSIPHEARVIINPGKNFDEWWNIDKLIEQIKTRAIPIFEKTHPETVAVFAFDNSSSHIKLADDTLNAANMNLNSGGKQPIICD